MMKSKLLLCLALVLSGALFGCATEVQSKWQANVLYSKPSPEFLRKIRIERGPLTKDLMAKLTSLPRDKTEFESQWLVAVKPHTMRPGPWNTQFYIFDSGNTSQCARVEVLDHACYEVTHHWLNEKLLYVSAPWGQIAWTDFVLNTQTLRPIYIEDGRYAKTLMQQEAAESFLGYGLDQITSHIFGIEGKIAQIHKTPTELKTITVTLIKPLPTALGWVPYDKPGQTVVIHFNESLSRLGQLRLATGNIVKVAFGDGVQSLNPDDWGSNFSWLYVEKNSHFYNTKGEMVVSDPDENL